MDNQATLNNQAILNNQERKATETANTQSADGTQSEQLKTVPSSLEMKFADFLYQFVDLIPMSVHPNVVTGIGIVGGILGGICFFLGSFSRWFFLPAVLGLITHIVCDDFDGHMARTRGLATKRGAFFDITSDVLVSTITILCIGLSSYAHLEVLAFGLPLYGIYAVIALHYIMLYNEFPFPHVGPFELHCFYITVAILNAIFGQVTLFSIGNFPFYLIDVLLLPGIVSSVLEIGMLGFKLFFRLKKDGK